MPLASDEPKRPLTMGEELAVMHAKVKKFFLDQYQPGYSISCITTVATSYFGESRVLFHFIVEVRDVDMHQYWFPIAESFEGELIALPMRR
jgi:hypothetical protein